MQRLAARWLLEHDETRTRDCYAQLPIGTGCTCNQCRNFDAARGRNFPAEFIALLDSLGIDSSKPAELCHYCREPSGLYLTGGWFHFVGQIVNGEDAMQWEKNNGTIAFETLVPELEFAFTGELALVRDVFVGTKLLQLEFQTCIPWVLAEPEPPA